MIGLIEQLFQTPKLDTEGIRYRQQAPAGPREVDVLGYKVKNYRDAGKLGGLAGLGIGAYLGSTTYGLIPGLFTGLAGGFILGGLAGLGIYGLYRLYKWGEGQFRRATQPQPTG